MTSSLGENQTKAHLARLDSYWKGYNRGEPDIELKCKKGTSTGVVVIELKNHDGSNWLSCEQMNYLGKLKDINVQTCVSNSYVDIV